MIESVVEKWHQYLGSGDPGQLEALLDDEVIFYSPIVYTPQVGRELTTMYLRAAGATFTGGETTENRDDRERPFRYTKQVLAGDTAVLEFETTMAGKYVNGVDIIRCNTAGRIVEFRVMIRPLQAVNTVHRQMGQALGVIDGTI